MSSRTAGPRAVRAVLTGLLLAGTGLVVACSAASPGPAGPGSPGPPAPSLRPGSTPAPSLRPGSTPAIVEPTTTNTLPPPPAPTAPAPSTAGRLSAAALPVPTGWRTVALPGGEEEGYQGNGTWVHARDPRYAALDVITVGCADVTRDDYTDPHAALEGTYRQGAEDGIGLVLEFTGPAAARGYFARYLAQVKACTPPDADPHTAVLAEPVAADGGRGLVDHRTYAERRWTEMAELNGARLTLIILSDPQRRIGASQAQAVLDQIGP